MGMNSKIEWTHHTFNPWWGCIKLSPACTHCYAETWAKRVGQDLWRATSARRFFGAAHWAEPLKWNEQARGDGERKRVFCASMADVFEARSELDPWREKLWDLIARTPHLDWLLLTKRPDHIGACVPWSEWPHNVWLGTTAETQKWADLRIAELEKHRAAVRFISAEPLLGPLDLAHWFSRGAIDWVIAGGESGPKARPTKPRWVRTLRDDCERHDIAFHFKQWGHWAPEAPTEKKKVRVMDVDAGHGEREMLFAIGKKLAGRQLDGRVWNGLPTGG
jgi:protein gp37